MTIMENSNAPSNHTHDDDRTVFDRMPPEAKALFFHVPVLSLESAASYMQIVDAVATTVGPDDILEWMFVRNIVDHMYNILFLRQVATGIVDIKRKDGLKSVLTSLLPDVAAKIIDNMAESWFIYEQKTVTAMRMLERYKLRPCHIDAEAARLHVAELGQLERMIASRESRLRLEYRELDMHRESKRIREELKNKSEPKKLPFIPPNELSDDKQDPAQNGPVNQAANDKL